MKTEHDETRLPRWAQIELTRLRADLEYAHRKLSAGPESLIVADPYSSAPRPLGDTTSIQFTLPGGNIHARIERGMLYLNGDTTTLIQPHSSNALHVSLKAR